MLLGLFYADDKGAYVAASVPVSELKRLQVNLKQIVEKGQMEGGAKSITLQGKRYATSGYLFEGEGVQVSVRSGANPLQHPWEVWFKFGKANRRIRKTEVISLLSNLRQWSIILEDTYGIDAEP